ncbi:MAG: tRNA pseudouridine(38-40) synthase TruA, partial [Pseudomonadota bacterium]
MPRFALKIEYHGGPFAGWQRQVAHPSVQASVERALCRIGPAADVQGAGR